MEVVEYFWELCKGESVERLEKWKSRAESIDADGAEDIRELCLYVININIRAIKENVNAEDLYRSEKNREVYRHACAG